MTGSVTWRAVTGGRVRTALSAWQLERDEHHVVLHLPVGAPGRSRDGVRDGPRGGFLRLQNYLDSFSPRPWRWRDLVAVHRFGDGWSTWRWRTPEGEWTPGAYVNLERPWQESPIGWDTDDLTLDVVVHADGSVEYKDEHELTWAEEVGAYSASEAEQIRSYGRAAYARAEQRDWPLDADWDAWIPPSRPLPTLPADWNTPA